jgi:hypothetical protein
MSHLRPLVCDDDVLLLHNDLNSTVLLKPLRVATNEQFDICDSEAKSFLLFFLFHD